MYIERVILFDIKFTVQLHFFFFGQYIYFFFCEIDNTRSVMYSRRGSVNFVRCLFCFKNRLSYLIINFSPKCVFVFDSRFHLSFVIRQAHAIFKCFFLFTPAVVFQRAVNLKVCQIVICSSLDIPAAHHIVANAKNKREKKRSK